MSGCFGQAWTAWPRRIRSARTSVGLILGLGAVALGGCGFQLRGGDIASAYASVRVEADASVDFTAQLRAALATAGVSVVADGTAPLVIRLARQRAERRPSAVGADARAAEYTLALAVEVAYRAGDGTPLAPADTIDTQRAVAVRRDSFLGSGAEEALLATEMRAELTGRILRTAAALARRPETETSR